LAKGHRQAVQRLSERQRVEDLGAILSAAPPSRTPAGLVDADYIKNTGDTTYREGQRIVVKERVVRECLVLIQKLTTSMTTDLPTSQ
jgi:hypothetical protein